MNKTVIALGFFDGVHKGHQIILKTAVDYAKDNGLQSAACTFDRHPRAFVHGIAPAMLTTLPERVQLIRNQAVERVEVIAFDKSVADMLPDDFAALLKEKYNCVAAVCGGNFRFGKMAGGGFETLERNGIHTIVCEAVSQSGETVSSTRIRKLLQEGEARNAAELLGRNYSISGTVVNGFQIGRRIGVPTMNLRPEGGLLIPKRGVYASCVTVNGQVYKAITNIGTRPTFSKDDIVSVESFIFGFSGNIYGEAAAVEFVQRIRDEKRFDSERKLVEQIEKDIEQAECILKG